MRNTRGISVADPAFHAAASHATIVRRRLEADMTALARSGPRAGHRLRSTLSSRGTQGGLRLRMGAELATSVWRRRRITFGRVCNAAERHQQRKLVNRITLGAVVDADVG